ncbi:MAG: T9SS type A sorting domain-containing protein, partial [Muribaculaceae bacterium]
LAAGTYYSVTLTETGTSNGNVVKFNTYAKTTTGLDALLKKAADYVEIGSEIFVQAHHHNHYLAYTTESSTYVAPRAEQDTKYYGDAPEKFAKRDWVKIYAPVEDEFVGKNIAAGTIIEVATGKAVKWGTVGSAAPAFTTNLYRPLNFSATETEKDVMYIFQPQEGEVLQVRGKYAKEGNQEYLTDESGTHKVGLLGYTGATMTVDQWYTLDGHVCDGVVCYNKVETATGVESVETANATVFAANGTINVSSEAQASIEVYTANGQMVRAINADNASIAVAPGFYLVKVGNQVSKVVVK